MLNIEVATSSDRRAAAELPEASLGLTEGVEGGNVEQTCAIAAVSERGVRPCAYPSPRWSRWRTQSQAPGAHDRASRGCLFDRSSYSDKRFARDGAQLLSVAVVQFQAAAVRAGTAAV